MKVLKSPQLRKIIEWNHIQSIGSYLNAFTAVTQLPSLVGMRPRQTQSATPYMQKIKRNQSEQSIFLQNKNNKKHRSIYSQNIQIYASSQSRLTQAIYQTRNEQYFETLKFMKKKPSDPKPTHK